MNLNKIQNEFNIEDIKIKIIPHGVFVPKYNSSSNISQIKNDKYKMLLFGFQSMYKGTDILVTAYKNLPVNIKSKIELRIFDKRMLRYPLFMSKVCKMAKKGL